jgi:lysyl-tRNA synthetase class 2
MKTTEVNDLTEIRKAKRKALLKQGTDVYPVQIPKTTNIKDIIKKYGGLQKGTETGKTVGVAGRIIFIRDIGKLIFIKIQNGDGDKIQIMLNESKILKSELEKFKTYIDLGDIIYAFGEIISSKTGELSILAKKWMLASKSLKPLPVLHKDLSIDTRIRNRSIELITSENARKIARTRVKIVSTLRHFLEEQGFLEIETPILQTLHGGAMAKPFSTKMNAYNIELFLRIAPELFLKRAAVGGFEKVFEINRNFRNEGADSSHSPEFSMLELYEAYGDYNSMAELTKKIVQKCAKKISDNNDYSVTLNTGKKYDFGGEWKSITVYESLSNATNYHIDENTKISELKEIAKKFNVKVSSDHQKTAGKFVEVLFEELVGSKIYEPTFVKDFPLETSPLTRQNRNKENTAEKWDLYVRGMELATAYSELIDPVIQREKFIEQAKQLSSGDKEAMQLDNDFLSVMEYGLPPTGGMGMGIDRLLIALTGLGIRDTILFPLVKPIN